MEEVPMTDREYETRIAQAQAVLSRRQNYMDGYIRGLRRFHEGPRHGSLQEHEKWLSMAYDRETTMSERGRGYMDGLQGRWPKV